MPLDQTRPPTPGLRDQPICRPAQYDRGISTQNAVKIEIPPLFASMLFECNRPLCTACDDWRWSVKGVVKDVSWGKRHRAGDSDRPGMAASMVRWGVAVRRRCRGRCRYGRLSRPDDGL